MLYLDIVDFLISVHRLDAALKPGGRTGNAAGDTELADWRCKPGPLFLTH